MITGRQRLLLFHLAIDLTVLMNPCCTKHAGLKKLEDLGILNEALRQ